MALGVSVTASHASVELEGPLMMEAVIRLILYIINYSDVLYNVSCRKMASVIVFLGSEG